MRRPADQAKLLLLYLLKSSAALATENRNNVLHQGHICLRLARRTDVPSLQRCNLATLPENYNSAFYVSHLRQWPDLALVAEHVEADDHGTQNHRNGFPGAFTVGQPQRREPKIVGYVLGKVESKPPPFPIHTHLMTPQERDYLYESHAQSSQQVLGHVTSLAVLHDYRRQGLAAALMGQLHYHLQQNHGASSVGLHVRKSNSAAARLYQSDGYSVENVIPHYYQDGEDAYFMSKRLDAAAAVQQPRDNRSYSSRPWPWKQQPEAGPFSLPRVIPIPEPQTASFPPQTPEPATYPPHEPLVAPPEPRLTLLRPDFHG